MTITPIFHASMILQFGEQTIYIDPAPLGGADSFIGTPTPSIILVSDIHPDHLDVATLQTISRPDTIIFVPQAVKDVLPDDIAGKIIVIHNGEIKTEKGITIEAIPMYNIPESPSAKHTKGRGNGYILTAEDTRVYIAGDTDAIAEMKALQDIDVAFVPMNPPYTMSVEEAAESVLAFKPNVVHPYHYRTPEGLSDVEAFKKLVQAKDPTITVELLDFYPSNK